MADPGRGTPLALDIAGVSRSLPVPPDAAQTVPVPERHTLGSLLGYALDHRLWDGAGRNLESDDGARVAQGR
jgi:hypothetical protein